MTSILIGALILVGLFYGLMQWALCNIAHEIPGLHDIDTKEE